MSQNNSSTPAAPKCEYPAWFWSLGDILQWSSINVVMPVFLVIGLFGHTICYRAFVKQAQSEKAYVYQIYLVLAEIVGMISFALFMLAYQWSGMNTIELGSIDGWAWFQELYAPMFFAAHMAIPFCNGMSLVCLLLSVSMAGDRVFAFVRPFKYKYIEHKWHQRSALVLSTAIGFLVTFCNAFIFEVDISQYPYKIAANIPYLISNLAFGLALILNAARIFALLALISCNLALIRLYKRRHLNVAQMNAPGNRNQEGKRDARKKSNEKTLTLLTLCQSFFTSVSMLSYFIFYMAAYTVPSFNICEHRVFAPALDIAIMLCDTADTFATVLINKKTRKLILRYISVCEGKLVPAQTDVHS